MVSGETTESTGRKKVHTDSVCCYVEVKDVNHDKSSHQTHLRVRARGIE